METARINLIYTRVLSPITGRIGRSLVTEGALVTANQATALATVQQLDPIYVDVTQPSTTLLRLQARAGRGTAQAERGGKGPGAAAAGGRQRLRAPRHTGVFRGDGGPGHGLGHAACAVAQSRAACCCRACSCASRSRKACVRVRVLAPQQGITHDQKGEPNALVVGRRQHGRAADHRDRPRHRRSVAGDFRAQARRPGDRRGAPVGEARHQGACPRSTGRRARRRKPAPRALQRRTAGSAK